MIADDFAARIVRVISKIQAERGDARSELRVDLELLLSKLHGRIRADDLQALYRIFSGEGKLPERIKQVRGLLKERTGEDRTGEDRRGVERRGDDRR